MKTKEEIIKEFQKATPIWYKQFPKELQNKPCIMCGIIPNNLLKLSKALSQQKQEIVKDIMKFVESESGKSGRKEIINYLKQKLTN